MYGNASLPDSTGVPEPFHEWKPGEEPFPAFQALWPALPPASAVPAPPGQLTSLHPWLDVLPDAVVIIDQAGLIALVNRQVESLFGYAPKELVGLPLEILLPERLHTAHVQHRLRYITEPRIRPMGVGLDLFGRRKDGAEVPVDISLSPLSSAGTPYILSVIRDITERRRLEREVAERAAALQATFEAITDGIALMDRQGLLLQTNRAFRTLFGVDQYPEYATRSIQDRPALLALHDEQGEPLPLSAWPPVRLLHGEVLTGVDAHIKNLGGREVVVNVRGAPLYDERGQLSGAVEVFRDVTERRQLEQRTREALNALVAMGEALVHVQQVAPSAELAEDVPPPPAASPPLPLVARRLAELTQRVLGCRRVSIAAVDAATGRFDPIMVVGLPPDQEQAWWSSWSSPRYLEERLGAPSAAALSRGESVVLEAASLPEHERANLYQAKTGRMTPMCLGGGLVGILFVDYGEQDHAYFSQEEITLTAAIARLAALVIERERLLGEREEARATALAERETSQQMDAFLSLVSHELKQPLTVLQGNLQLAQRRAWRLANLPTALPPPQLKGKLAPLQEQLTGMARQTERQDGLINDLLDAARIRTGKLAIHPELVNLLPLVRGAVEEQRQLAPEREVHLDLPAAEDIVVLADGRRIEQVVTNYLTNALKYSPAACPVEVGVTLEDTRVCVWVRDQGPGIAQEQQQHIFERFYRVPGIPVQSGTGIGLGLGLYICRTLIEQQGGEVGVESTPGQGSTFWFTLPVGCPEEDNQ